MKKIFCIFAIICSLTITGTTYGQSNLDKLLLDSVYTSNWVSNAWSLNIKNYNVKDGSGRTIQDLFKKYNSGTGQFVDFAQFLNSYTGTDTVPTRTTEQLYYLGNWNTYYYSHYVAKNTLDTTYTKLWDNQHHKFISGVKNTYQYNDSLLPIINISQTLDTATLVWQNSSKVTYAYTGLNQPLEQIQLTWQKDSSAWKNLFKISDIYDQNNLHINHYEYEWNDSSYTWINTLRITYTNNLASLPYTAIKEFWNASKLEWDTLQQITFIYNQENWLMTILTQNYQQSNGTWQDYYLKYYTYFPSGEIHTATGNIWDSMHSVYLIDSYQKMDSLTNKVAENYTYSVDQGTFLITGGVKDLYTFKPTGDTLTHVNQTWNVSGINWDNKSQILYSYDSHNLLSEELTQEWTTASSAWTNWKKSDYYYSEFIGIGEHKAKLKSCFYANPLVSGGSVYCPEFTSGQEYTFRICSLSGVDVYRTVFRGGESVRISGSLASGLYFLIIEEKNSIIYKDKIVIIH